MAFLLSTKKEPLIELAEDLGLIAEASLSKPKKKDLIVKIPDCWYWDRTRDKASHDPIPIPLGYRGHPDYVEEDVKLMFDSIVKDRIRKEEKEEKFQREELEYELEKLRIYRLKIMPIQ
ncbi:hypothetical protein TNCV_4761271 [Trichonephila clavipes]|uniref:Uncharacterized protein n=1 Tax=Trichonephila clavipes TaxID=2585209 RepID=A0A8X6RDZ8_TRICX|nr:hypothetical protein TNCV_4761271 [Trichonephila clavipes]